MPKYVMSDGRTFTDYNPSCSLNKMIQEKFKLSNSHQYRAFLQQNAEELMKEFSKQDMEKPCLLCPVCKQALEYKPGQQ